MNFVCNECNDTHKAPYSGNMCLYCPKPCGICRMAIVNGEQFPGAYCAKIPCECSCHPFNAGRMILPPDLTDREIVERLVKEAIRLGNLINSHKAEERRTKHSEEWNEGYEACAGEILDSLDWLLGANDEALL